jgi:hypothetical protein
MSDDSEQRPKRRRGRRDDPYRNFYAMYYGLDEGETTPTPTRHRATAGRTAAVLLAGVQSLIAPVRGRALLVLSAGLVSVGILVVGVMVSATRLGGDPAYQPSLVDGTPGSTPASTGSSSDAPASSSSAGSTSAGVTTSADQPVAGGPVDVVPPVYYPPTTGVAGPATGYSSNPGNPTTSSQPSVNPHPTTPHTTSQPPPPPRTTSQPPPPPTSSSNPPTPTPTPTPSPTHTCLVPDPAHPGHCILAQP